MREITLLWWNLLRLNFSDMATKKFLIEVEEGIVECENCPFDGCKCSHEPINTFDCNKYNLATMKIKEMEESQ